MPVTTRPNFGSASVTVWPPPMMAPASATLAAAPAKMAVIIAGGRSSGKPATLRARRTVPPMA
ncbi:hypothetical protein D3C83_134110 [compost metagenome]